MTTLETYWWLGVAACALALAALVVLVVIAATRAARRDLGQLPQTWTPNRGDLRRHNREIREIRGV